MSDVRSLTNPARQIALAIRQIAADRNLLRLGGSLRINSSPDLYEASATAFNAEVTETLERQAVTAIGVNEPRNTVYIYTNRRVTKAQEKILPFNVSTGVKIEYRQARPLTITDNEADDVLGALPFELTETRYACGSSISIANVRAAGTLGAIVQGSDGTLYGLTNNHVSGGCNNARVGLPIAAPGIMDVQVNSHDPFTVGWHHAVLQMRQGDPSAVNARDNTDAALFRLRDASLITTSQGGVYDTPTTVVDPQEDMEVEKFGRTTKHTLGRIEAEIIGPYPVNYKTVTWHSASESTAFQGQVFFEPVYLIRGRGKPFSLPGDSGSLVVTRGLDGKRAAVGLIFAGREPNDSYMLPLRPILDRFQVALVDQL